MSTTSPWIVNVTDADFEAEVLQRSREVPVVLDFWAPWCGPCRLLGPILEKLAVDFDGQFVLVKANTDEAPRAAGEFQVEGIPAVFALRDGAPIDFFTGALPEPAIREWLQRILPSPTERKRKQAEMLQVADPEQAAQLLREILADDANDASAKILLAEISLEQGRGDEAEKLLAELEARGYLEPAAERLKAELHLAKSTGASESSAALAELAAKSPQDLALQVRLARALAAEKQFEAALKTALAVVRIDMGEYRKEAKTLMVDLLRLMPDDSPVAATYQRKLSTALT